MAIGCSLGKATTRATLVAMAWALATFSARSQQPRVHVETRDASLSGRLESFDSRVGVRIDSEGSLQAPIAEVIKLQFEQPTFGPPASRPAAGEVYLIDGSRLAYQAYELENGSLILQLSDNSHCQISLSSLRRWWLNPREKPSEIESRVADRLWVKPRQGEGVTPVEGVVMEMAEEGVRFAFSGDDSSEPVVAPWSRLAGIDFFRETAGANTPKCLVTLSSGGRLAAEELRVLAGRLEWSSRHGKGEFDLQKVNAIDLSAGSVASVSSLKLLTQTWRPYYGAGQPGEAFALDSSFEGGAIRLLEPDPRALRSWPAVSRERVYDSGVAMKSRGEACFALPPHAARLKGWIGLSPCCVRSGSAEVAVLADERLLWSGAIDGSTRPVEINAPLKGAATLTLRVDYGDNLDAGDHIHFADLRVIQ